MNYINEKLEEFNNWLKNKKVAIIGLGVSNGPLIEYMQEKQGIVTVFDKRNEEKIDNDILRTIEKYKIEKCKKNGA